ncbi:SGNH/GDSL hydrolase family protein [Promicromonospora sp. NPDC060271]|uniref:golvesin C-terminal-like domain-containing protein n=1 Tax=Promicromonospora sp. NPDC060271 TaxID=3347089 RepID=UPI00364C3E6B
MAPKVTAQSEQGRPSAVPERDRAEVLPENWKTSGDVAWATVGDANGFHVLTATAESGYSWGVTATLVEAGYEADEWIGNACVTSSGRYAVVVYAPRMFVNKPDLFDRGALSAVVDLKSGAVTKLSVTASLAYFNPGCGAADLAVISAARADDDQGDTRLVTVNAASGRLGRAVELRGQVTSAVPVSSVEYVAATGRLISRIEADGQIVPVAKADSVPSSLALDADGGVVYLDTVTSDPDMGASPSGPAGADAAREEDEVATLRLDRSQWGATPDKRNLQIPTQLARGDASEFGLVSAPGGKVAIIGEADVSERLPSGLTHLPALQPSTQTRVSTNGEAVVDGVGWDSDVKVADPTVPRSARLMLHVPEASSSIELGVSLATGHDLASDAAADAGTQNLSPALEGIAVTAMVSTDLADGESERACGVTRGDPQLQAMQPRPRQVEWAVDQLVQGTLDRAYYPEGRDGWRIRAGSFGASPGAVFPLPELAGPRTVADIPPQIILGIAMSESNMQQATRSSVPGVTGNPLIGNYWGVTDGWDIDFTEADCGYGIMQVTDGMEVNERPQEDQNKIAVDYVFNIQAGVQILVEKWNQTYNAGARLHDGDATRVEDWFYALWAYNSGWYPRSDADINNGAWGVGWHNNPANPKYPPYRLPFLNNNHFDDGRTPNLWPYPERTLGFAAWSSELIDGVGTTAIGFRPARWTLNEHRETIKPWIELFCDESNRCDKDRVGDVYTGPDAPEVPGPCYSQSQTAGYDFRCWYHEPASWKEYCSPGTGTASPTCGEGFSRFPRQWTGDEDPYQDGVQQNPHSVFYDEEENQRSYAPNCSIAASSTTNSAPPNSWIVDDVPHGIPSVKKCARSSSGGTFTWRLAQAANGTFPPKRDIHQVGAGWQGHFFFSHTRTGEAGGTGDQLRAAGTWRLGRSHNGWMRIAVHLPDHGAHTQQARYNIDLNGDGTADRHRYINQRRMANNWVSLGSYRVDGVPSVTLSNITEDGEGTQDVAWDAVAFQPLDQEPVKVAVLGDSFSSGEGTGFAAESGAAGYYAETNVGGDLEGTNESDWQNSCRRSPDAWARKLTVPGTSGTVGSLVDRWSSEVEFGFVACSGAQTKDLLNVPWGDGVGSQYGEVRQARAGVLDDETDLVLLTIGGNDGDLFSAIVTDCIQFPACQTRPPLDTAYDQVDDNTLPAIENVMGVIQRRAPNAKIVVGTYPELFSYDPDVIELCWVEPGEASHILALQAYFSGQLETLLTRLYHDGLDVSMAYAELEFRGHDTCVLDAGGDNWINPPLLTATDAQGSGDSQDMVSRASIHPNDRGTDAYARAFNRGLREVWPQIPLAERH